MKRLIVGFAVLLVVLSFESPFVNGAIITADVAVSSPGGQYALLAAGELVSTNWNLYYWYDIPGFAVEQDMLFWQYEHTGFPDPADSTITFEVLSNGPVLMACTTRTKFSWTTREELAEQGWTEFATGLKDAELGGPVPYIEYDILRRDSVAGEVFTYRTEYYRPPTIIRSVITVPSPSTTALLLVGALVSLMFARRK